jgi:hypothetical protein
VKNKQDMTNLAMELFFAQIDFELYKLYDCDCDDNAERKLKELRQKFYHDSLEYFLNNEAFKKIEEYELKQIKIKEATCKKIDYEKILNS